MQAEAKPLDRRLAAAFAWVLSLALIVGAAGLGVYGGSYYLMPAAEQVLDPRDPLLRSSAQIGLWLGLGAGALVGLNVAYLVRRNLPVNLRFVGSPRSWMTVHVVTGLAAPLVALFHSGFDLKTPLGAGALLLMGTASLAGIVGRYLYSVVPRGASGRELELAQIRSRARELTRELDEDVASGSPAAGLLRALLEEEEQAEIQGRPFARRVLDVFAGGVSRWRRLRRVSKAMGRSKDERRMLRTASALLLLKHQAARKDELHRLLSTWRGLHRWMALSTLLLLLGHVYVAVTYARLGP